MRRDRHCVETTLITDADRPAMDAG